MNPFQNPQIEVNQLPESESLQFIGLEKSYRTILLVTTSIFWLVLFLGIIVSFFTGGASIIALLSTSIVIIFIPIILIGLIGFSYLSILFGFRHKAYALRLHDIQYKSGWIWRKKIIIPFKRIQHSEVTQGPIERRFSLAKLHIYTAGGSASDLTIPGLKYAEAEQLKYLITNKIGTNGEEE